MATEPPPQPQLNFPMTDPDARVTLQWRQYLPRFDLAVRSLVQAFSGQFTSPVPLIAVGTPTNANAATAGVAIGQLYTDTANPAKVYVRTA
jgi:hypothetical protein